MNQTTTAQAHPAIDQLLASRDGRLISTDVMQHLEHCGACQARLAELEGAPATLAGLPDPEPDMALWSRLTSSHEVLVRDRKAGVLPLSWQAPWLSVAAGLGLMALGALLALQFAGLQSPSLPVDLNPVSSVQPGSGLNGSGQEAQVSVASLQQRSGELEAMLDRLGQPGVRSIREVSAVESLQSSIALVDYQLAAGTALGEQQRRELWQRRVDLMESLVTVSVAADRANSI
ncbi:MAG: hypothetical protein R3217_02470 [Gammaproteobacteria bacterium]|nr:hypothetical protein [Gammaproteobacteria bacterium]